MFNDFFGPGRRDVSRDKSWSEDPLWLRCSVLIGTGAIWCTVAWAVLR